jgi:hypothetical protein
MSQAINIQAGRVFAESPNMVEVLGTRTLVMVPLSHICEELQDDSNELK